MKVKLDHKNLRPQKFGAIQYITVITELQCISIHISCSNDYNYNVKLLIHALP